MSGDDLKFEEFIALCDEQYEAGLIEFKNGDIVNMPGENEGSAKVLSYAALADFDKEMTLKVSLRVTICLLGDECQHLSRCRVSQHISFLALSSFLSVFEHNFAFHSFGGNITETSSPLPMARITKTFATS